MSSFKNNLTILTLGLALALGCKKKEASPAKDEAAPAATAAAATSSEKTPEQKLEEEVEQLATQLDMPEDYLTAAEAEINDENLAAELAKLEKEVAEDAKAFGITLPDPSKKLTPAPGASGLTKPPVPLNKAPAPAHNH